MNRFLPAATIWKIWLALRWVSVLPVLLQAQSAPAINFQRVAQDQVLAEAEISGLAQDQQGFLWVSTRANGLYRYDGYGFKAYIHDLENPASLTRNTIHYLFQSRAGKLWVSLDGGGLEYYEPAINGFVHYRHDPQNPASLSHNTVRGLWEDQAGQLWVGTRFGGVSVLNTATNLFTTYQHNPQNSGSLIDSTVYRGLLDRAGRLWVGTANGLEQFDPASQQFIHRTLPLRDVPANERTAIIALAEDRAGNLWVGTITQGLYKYDLATNSFKSYRHHTKQSDSLGADKIYSILVDSVGDVWIGLNEGGLDKYDPTTDSFFHYRKDRLNPYSLPSDSVTSLFEDRIGILWVGTSQGLCKYDRASAAFKTAPPVMNTAAFHELPVQALLEDEAGQLWMCTNQGVVLFDPHSGRKTVFRHDPMRKDSLSTDSLYTIYQDRTGRIWISGGLNELNLYLPAQRRFKRYAINAQGQNRAVFTVFEDKSGRLLVSSWLNGLQQYDATKDHFIPFQPAGLPQIVNEDTAITIREDRSGQLWLGLRLGGVVRYDSASKQWLHYQHNPADAHSLSDNQVTDLLIDHQGTIWVATLDGLNRFDPLANNFTHYTVRDGLPDNVISSIQEDAQGRLWLGTQRGLVSFAHEQGTMRVYDSYEGLPSNSFFDRASWRNTQGELLFGTLKGLVRFYPQLIQARPSSLHIALTEIRKFEQPFAFGALGTADAGLAFTWRDSLLTFEFAALGLHQPQKAQYAWKLEGYDQDWVLGAAKRTATYTNLPGGNYILRVKATDETGQWSEKQLAVRLSVTAPPWKRWWAYLFYVLAGAGLIVGYVRYRINQLHVINDAKTQFAQQLITSQEAERKRIAAELHDGLGQSLLVIKNRTIIGKKMAQDSEKVTSQLDEISKATGQALEEVRSIAYNLRPYHLERLGLCASLEAMIEKIRAATGVEINARLALFDEVFSKDNEVTFYRVIQECLNNVIKHADATAVEISIVQNESQVTAHIQDNGRGFVATDAQTGGFGLIGISERVRMLGGQHSIASEIGKGTTVTVTIPLHEVKDAH